jgi:hypothetical protein
MNLRRMLHVPMPKPKINESWFANVYHVFWEHHLYTILEDTNSQSDSDCNDCDAHRHRIKIHNNHILGLCPDSDPTLNWTCFDGNSNRVLHLL